MNFRLFFFFVPVFLFSCSSDEEFFLDENNQVNILIIGNSYSRDAFSYVPSLLETMSPGIIVNMNILYVGGVSLSKHIDYIENNTPSFILDEYQPLKRQWISYKEVLARSIVSKMDWDCVIVQESSSLTKVYEDFSYHISYITNYVKSHQKRRGKYAFMINPAHPQGSKSLGKITTDEEFFLFAESARQILDNHLVDFVVPCGTAIQNARQTYLDMLGEYGHLSYDGRHLQEGIPCWIEAYVAAKILIQQLSLPVKDNPNLLSITQNWVYDKNIPGQHGEVIEGTEDDYKVCEKCALLAVEFPYAIFSTFVEARYPNVFSEEVFNVEAHGGYSNKFPENTLIAFEEAGKIPLFRGIETDVRITADGVLVCLHDKSLERTTDGTGFLTDYTYSQLQDYYINGGIGWNSSFAHKLKVPRFKDFLDICIQYGKIPYVELKGLSESGMSMVIETLHEKGFQDGQFVLTSFNIESLIYASSICKTPLEYMKGEFDLSEIGEYVKWSNIVLRPDANKITKEFVEMCRLKGIVVECWNIGVGNKALVERLRKWGVRGGTCNSWEGLGIN